MALRVIKAHRISDINVEDITFGHKRNNKIPIYLSDKPLVFQTPFLEVTGQVNETSLPNIFQLCTLFEGTSKQRIIQWYNFIVNMETYIGKQAEINGNQWFTQQNVSFKSMIKDLSSEKDMFIKWAISESCGVVDGNKNSLELMSIKDHDLIKLIVEISDLWTNESQCGLVFLVQKIMVKDNNNKIESEYIFDESESNSCSEDEKQTDIISLLATEQKPLKSKKQIDNKSEHPPSFHMNMVSDETIDLTKPNYMAPQKTFQNKKTILDHNGISSMEPNTSKNYVVPMGNVFEIENDRNNMRNKQTPKKSNKEEPKIYRTKNN